MYLKNNQNFLYIFIIATLAYHEQFFSVNVNNEEEKKEEEKKGNNEIKKELEEKIPEEIYCKGCCDCNIFTVNPPSANKDLIDKFDANNQIGNFEKMLISLGLENKKKIDNEGEDQKDSKLLALHKLLNSNFALKSNGDLIGENLDYYEAKNNEENMNIDYEKKITIFKKEENFEQVSVLCKYQKQYTYINDHGWVENLDRIIGRFIKINNRIPCLFFQMILKDPNNNNELRPKEGRNLIIYFHGLGDSIVNYFEIYRYNKNENYFEKQERDDINDILRQGYDLAIIEYKGGGYYDGDFDEDDFRDNDAKDIFKFFSKLYTNNEIIAMGYSLGCAFASQFTAKAEEILNENNNNEKKNTIKICILIYPFINIKQAGKHIFETQGGWFGNHFSWIINLILKLKFDNKKWVSNIHSKLLLVNNKNDTMCNEKSIIPLKAAFLGGGGEIEYIPKEEENYETYKTKEKILHIMKSDSGNHFNIDWNGIKIFLQYLQTLDLYDKK